MQDLSLYVLHAGCMQQRGRSSRSSTGSTTQPGCSPLSPGSDACTVRGPVHQARRGNVWPWTETSAHPTSCEEMMDASRVLRGDVVARRGVHRRWKGPEKRKRRCRGGEQASSRRLEGAPVNAIRRGRGRYCCCRSRLLCMACMAVDGWRRSCLIGG